MISFALNSLVLQGVTVQFDGQVVELCQVSAKMNWQTPENRISMRHQSLGYPGANPNTRTERHDPFGSADMDAAVVGAGRSLGQFSSRNPAFGGSGAVVRQLQQQRQSRRFSLTAKSTLAGLKRQRLTTAISTPFALRPSTGK